MNSNLISLKNPNASDFKIRNKEISKVSYEML